MWAPEFIGTVSMRHVCVYAAYSMYVCTYVRFIRLFDAGFLLALFKIVSRYNWDALVLDVATDNKLLQTLDKKHVGAEIGNIRYEQTLFARHAARWCGRIVDISILVG